MKAKNSEALLALRREVLGDEVKNWRDDDPYSPLFFDEFDGSSTHLVVKSVSDGKAVAYGRITHALSMRRSSEWAKAFHLDVFSGETLEHTVIFSKVMVAAPYHKSEPATVLMKKLYESALDSSTAWIAVMLSNLNEFNFNRFLGFRPLTRIEHSPFGGWRIPLFLIVHDYKRLNASASPLEEAAKKKGSPKITKGMEWMDGYYQKGGKIDTGFFTFDARLTKNVETAVTRGMTEKGHEEFMAKAFYLKCKRDETVLRRGEGGTQMGFVIRGGLEVRSGEKTLAILGDGDIFGEIACVLGTPRTADVVVAVPETEIMLLRLSAVENLSENRDQAVFWKNLSIILAARLLQTTRQVAGLEEGGVFGEIAREFGHPNAAEAAAALPDVEKTLSNISAGQHFSAAGDEPACWKKLAQSLAQRLSDISRKA